MQALYEILWTLSDGETYTQAELEKLFPEFSRRDITETLTYAERKGILELNSGNYEANPTFSSKAYNRLMKRATLRRE